MKVRLLDLSKHENLLVEKAPSKEDKRIVNELNTVFKIH